MRKMVLVALLTLGLATCVWATPASTVTVVLDSEHCYSGCDVTTALDEDTSSELTQPRRGWAQYDSLLISISAYTWTSGGDSNETLDISLQTRRGGGTWITILSMTQLAYNATTNEVKSYSAFVDAGSIHQVLGDSLRVYYNVGGSTPSWDTVTVDVILRRFQPGAASGMRDLIATEVVSASNKTADYNEEITAENPYDYTAYDSYLFNSVLNEDSGTTTCTINLQTYGASGNWITFATSGSQTDSGTVTVSGCPHFATSNCHYVWGPRIRVNMDLGGTGQWDCTTDLILTRTTGR